MQVLGLSLPLWQKISLLVLGIALVIVSLSFMARGRRTGEESTLSIFGMEIAGGWTVVFTLGLLSSVIALSSLENGEFWASGLTLARADSVGDGVQQHRAAVCPPQTQ